MFILTWWLSVTCDSSNCPSLPAICGEARRGGVRYVGRGLTDCHEAARSDGWLIGRHLVLCPACIASGCNRQHG